jgi:type I restriction enzyme S subunit
MSFPAETQKRRGMKTGWQTKPFEECIEAVKYTQKIQRKDFLDDGLFPIVSQEAEFINGYWDDEADVFKISKPLIVFGDHTQVLKYVDFDFVLGADGVKILPPREFLRPKFFFYQLQAVNFYTLGYARHYRLLKGLKIKYPPLPEQERIVGILDEAFEGIAKAKALAEANLQNARALFQSHLQSVFSQKDEGWMEKPFEDLIESNVIGVIKSSREQGEDKEWPYVKMNNITRDNRFDFSNYTSVDATPDEVRKFSLSDGDFLFNTRNSHELVGKSCIYESDSNDAVLFNNNIMRIRFKNGINAHFVLLAFSSKSVSDELNSLKSGTTNVSAIYYKDLKSLMVPIPPIQDQKTIAVELKSLSAETQRLESLYQSKLNALDELKKSLLHQAFSGNL